MPQITYFGSQIWEVSCKTVINNAIVDLEVPDVGLIKVKVSFHPIMILYEWQVVIGMVDSVYGTFHHQILIYSK